MKRSLKAYVGIQICFFIFLHITDTQQSCPPPDVPLGGFYTPMNNSYLPEDEVNYECSFGYLTVGTTIRKCETNGDWSDEIPFCDPESEIKNLSSRDSQGNAQPIPEVTYDDSSSVCFSLKSGESIRITLEEPIYLYGVALYLKEGDINIEITHAIGYCSMYENFVEEDQWVFIECHKYNLMFSYLTIREKSISNKSSTFCNVQIYPKSKGCLDPPKRRIGNGYFEVSRSLAILICEEGYEADKNNDRLVCEGNAWVGSRLQCNNISKANTDTTPTNCIAYGALGFVVGLILFSLLAIAIYWVRKLRKEVVEDQHQSIKGRMVPRSDLEMVNPTYQ